MLAQPEGPLGVAGDERQRAGRAFGGASGARISAAARARCSACGRAAPSASTISRAVCGPHDAHYLQTSAGIRYFLSKRTDVYLNAF
ncbi:hypothetical protein AQ860_25690 [Burkholderia pseudomallei]|nr:hypothetical protein AQ760_01555 [Burkholderia pseudomallei]OMZ27581.1 hypothetical protein AQ860_25690 [Burkholderia pseudomallei]OMZ29962.1 hypothetical protein AQ859_01055 [Burkholderia pseudomallei]